MKKLSVSRQNLILKILEILVDENNDSTGNSDSSTTADGREYLLDDNEQQVLYEIKKLLNRED